MYLVKFVWKKDLLSGETINVFHAVIISKSLLGNSGVCSHVVGENAQFNVCVSSLLLRRAQWHYVCLSLTS